MKTTDFRQLNINTENPGFYNDPNFVKIEKNNPDFLSEYNRYVVAKKYHEDYLARSRKIINIVCKILFDELKKDSRLGACIDICQVITKILEKEKIWCCMFSGSMTLQFEDDLHIPNRYFWYLDEGEYDVPHAWIYAPPYKIVDISISLQKYDKRESSYIPEYVLKEKVVKAMALPIDIINPKQSVMYNKPIMDILYDLTSCYPNIKKIMGDFPPSEVNYENCSVKYIPILTGAPEGELENLECINFSGKSAFEVYQEMIKQKLENI
jgi:hypothetical protein